MKKNFKQKVNHVIDRVNFKFNYVIANSIMKKKVDSKNDYFHIMDDEQLIDEIVNNKKSYTRFGDGELSLILTDKFDLNFQYNSKSLRDRLSEVLNSNLDNLIIGINRSFNNPDIYNEKTQKHCRTFNYLYREKFKRIIPNDKVYGNSSITRFYIDFDNSDYSGAEKRINNIKRIWKNRQLLIVEGEHSRLGVGNDLFCESKGIRRILVPETNAFNSYDEILTSVIENHQENELVLLAVGPTATILAYDLCKKGIQTIDVGHVDVEYEWFLSKVDKRVAIPGKYVNEIHGDKYTEDEDVDSDYERSIIVKI